MQTIFYAYVIQNLYILLQIYANVPHYIKGNLKFVTFSTAAFIDIRAKS